VHVLAYFYGNRRQLVLFNKVICSHFVLVPLNVTVANFNCVKCLLEDHVCLVVTLVGLAKSAGDAMSRI
jgi:hypothetical protein